MTNTFSSPYPSTMICFSNLFPVRITHGLSLVPSREMAPIRVDLFELLLTLLTVPSGASIGTITISFLSSTKSTKPL